MKSRTAIPCGLLLVVLIIAIILSRRAETEPAYQGQAVSEWALQLNSPSDASRREAQAVIQQFEPETIPALTRLLKTRDPVLSRPLRWIGWRLPTPMRMPLFRLVNPFVAPNKRAAAAHAFGIMGANARPALADLKRALRDEKTVAWYAALALANLGPAGVDGLADALSKTAPAQRGFVCHALGSMGPAASNAIPALAVVLSSGMPETAEAAGGALSKIGPLAVPSLKRALIHPSPEVRLAAGHGLAALGPVARECIPALAEIAAGDSFPLRTAALDALVQIRPRAELVRSALARALRDPTRTVRLHAVQMLRRYPEASESPGRALVELQTDESPEIRAQVAAALAEMKISAAVGQ
jgi:HEAT repeat protein